MLFPAKQRICPSAHPDLCLATIPPGGRSGGWGRSIWEERDPLGRSWRASPQTSSCCSEKPSTRGAAAKRSRPCKCTIVSVPTGHWFWRSVDLTGNQTPCRWSRCTWRFWRSVDLTGNQTSALHSRPILNRTNPEACKRNAAAGKSTRGKTRKQKLDLKKHKQRQRAATTRSIPERAAAA